MVLRQTRRSKSPVVDIRLAYANLPELLPMVDQCDLLSNRTCRTRYLSGSRPTQSLKPPYLAIVTISEVRSDQIRYDIT